MRKPCGSHAEGHAEAEHDRRWVLSTMVNGFGGATLHFSMIHSILWYHKFMAGKRKLEDLPERWWNIICNKRFWEVHLSELPGGKDPGLERSVHAQQFKELFLKKCRERGLKGSIRIKHKDDWYFAFCQAMEKGESAVSNRTSIRNARGAPSPDVFMRMRT